MTGAREAAPAAALEDYWSRPPAELLAALSSAPTGLSGDEVLRRRAATGPNRLHEARRRPVLDILRAQVASPLVLLLVGSAALSVVAGSHEDALIIFCIVLLGGALGFRQELVAARAVEALLGLVAVRARALRDGRVVELPTDELVPGDVVLLGAGSLVPADARLLEEKDLHVDEAALTGESFPAEKDVVVRPREAALSGRTCALFLGSHVVSGTGRAVVVHTGARTELGRIAGRLRTARPPTEFDQGLQRFGHLLMRVTAVLVIIVFAASVARDRPVLEALLFAVALAVGLVPELLPAIVNVTLARGAQRLARAKVVVKRLPAIQDLGSMTVLCTDKTGTLTEGRARLDAALGLDGAPCAETLRWGGVNAALESGPENPLDAAIEAACPIDRAAYRKLDEVPYDFVRKRVSVLVEHEGRVVLATKGALRQVLEVCAQARLAGADVPLAEARPGIEALHARLAGDGLRTLGVAVRSVEGPGPIDASAERDMTFLGLLVFNDPPRAEIGETLGRLRALGVRVVVITGDDRAVAASLAGRVGLSRERLVTGGELRAMSDEALFCRCGAVDLFAEVEPNQKERIILALKRAGAVVGYLGDGINDAPALHAADVGISVSGAVDVARQSADIILLDPDLRVLEAGVLEGRRTFVNILKYVYITTSANFGNMASMALAGPFLPFLPLLPKQILLNNLLSDLPAMGIAGDEVDPEQVERPRRWDTRVIQRFMLIFGAISAAFDLLTFFALLQLGATPAEFRAGWFLESLWTELLILVVMRTRRPFLRSRPSRALLILGAAAAAASLLVVFGPVGPLLGFARPSAAALGAVALVTLAYLVTSEAAKHLFFASETGAGERASRA